jgi:hypothetical protein
LEADVLPIQGPAIILCFQPLARLNRDITTIAVADFISSQKSVRVSNPSSRLVIKNEVKSPQESGERPAPLCFLRALDLV